MRSLLCLCACLLSVFVSAQMDPMGMQRSMFTAPSMIMAQPDIKKELKLSREQDKKISEISKAHMKKTQDAGKGRGNDLNAGLAQMGEMQKAQEEADKAILAELNPEQVRRLRQIQWQIVGPKALYEEDLQKELALSEDQVGKINEYRDGDAARAMEVLQKGARGMKDGMKKLREDAQKTLVGYLTAEQAAKYKEALGPESKAAKRLSDMVF